MDRDALDALDPKARDVLAEVLEMHREALSRILDGRRHEDELVASVLLIHGLHPVPVEERVRAAIEASGVRAELLDGMRIALHSGDVHRLEAALLARAPDADVRIESTGLIAPSTLVRARAPNDRCDVCRTELGDRHAHVLRDRDLRCVCPACASMPGARMIERHARACELAIDDATWDALGIPIGLAFFVRRDDDRIVALYPSPAGATESMLSLDAWQDVRAKNPDLRLEADVEALLVRRQTNESWLVSIDHCHALVGRIRKHWRGFTGGTELWQQVDAFFTDLREEAHA